MNSEHQKENQIPKATGLRRILRWFYIACIVSAGMDFVIHRHVTHPWEHWIFFYCVFGFVACVILVVVAKWMRKPLMRSEDYYDRN